MANRRTRIRTDFPGGNGTDFAWVDPRTLRFGADTKGGRYSMWFHFVVEDPDCDVLTCELRHVETALGWPYKPWVRPIFRSAEREWCRVAPTEINAGAGAMRFAVPCNRTATEIAFCYPYQADDWQRFYERTLASAEVRAVEVGTSEGGRLLVAYEWGNGPLEVLLTARHHSGETPGSYALEGAFAALIVNGDNRLTVRAIPFVDIDGVVEGMYGKERPPVDFNRAWSGEPRRVEIEAYKSCIASLQNPPVIAVDFHAPTPSEPHYIDYMAHDAAGDAPSLGRVLGSPTGSQTRENAGAGFPGRLARLVEFMTQRCAGNPCTALSAELTGPHPGWYPDGFERSYAGYLQATYGTLAFTVEVAYHAACNGEEVGPEEWRRLGRSVADGVRDFLSQESDGA